ncbi:hypothetical protein [Rugamonas sp.]|uniref:hypothetical protein n=1 Tax=Rugamonas sp. TaxID=1926287 RepID=UPI0025ECAC07|nr:hypothetical protein [Rugamonas sp.]
MDRITVVAMLVMSVKVDRNGGFVLVMSVSVDIGGILVLVMRRRLSLSRTRTARHESNGSPLQREGCNQNPEQVTDKYVHEP